MHKKTIIAAGYVRNSDSGKKDSEVLKAQIDALKEYAAKMGIDLPDHLIFADAISAIKYPYWERPALMQLWDEAERQSFDMVLCTEMFRLARKSSEQYAIMEYLKRYGVTVVSITEKFEDTAEGRLLHAVQGFLGEVEAEKIRIRTSRGKRHRAEKALTGQGNRLYGYQFANTPEYKNGRYVLNLNIICVDENGKEWTEVKVIVYCYDSCLSGMFARQIAMSLIDMGIPTPTGNVIWNKNTVRGILTTVNYTGNAYNWRYVGKGQNGVPRFPTDGVIKLPDGIVPKIIEPETFERVQEQLALNQQMASRNNPHPNETLLRAGLAYCGICGRRMRVSNHNKAQGYHRETQKIEYLCKRNDGVSDLHHHHCVSISVHLLDPMAWHFAVPYIKSPKLIREHVQSMKGQVTQRNHSQDLEEDLASIKKSIANLYKLAEAADPNDADGMQAFQERLITLERKKRETEKLLHGVSSTEEKQEKLLAALDRFEAWANTVRPFLDDPDYEPTNEDKRVALIVLGVKATVWPTEGYPERVRLELLPPDVAKYCEYCNIDFTMC